jgi:hypothetical protein
MYLYRATKDPSLLDIGVDILEAIEHSTKTKCGYPWHDPNTRCLCITKENDEYKNEKHLILFRLIERALVVTAYVDINTK